jgi:hypothetical protein
MDMKLLHAIALAVALLVAVWVYFSVGMPALHLNAWIGFIAWGAFFAAGGGAQAIFKVGYAGLAGIGLTFLALLAAQYAGGGLWPLVAFVTILAFALVAMADIPALAFTPAAFLGAASFFGSQSPLDAKALYVALTWVVGLGLGYSSERLAKWIAGGAGAESRLSEDPT